MIGRAQTVVRQLRFRGCGMRGGGYYMMLYETSFTLVTRLVERQTVTDRRLDPSIDRFWGRLWVNRTRIMGEYG